MYLLGFIIANSVERVKINRLLHVRVLCGRSSIIHFVARCYAADKPLSDVTSAVEVSRRYDTIGA